MFDQATIDLCSIHWMRLTTSTVVFASVTTLYKYLKIVGFGRACAPVLSTAQAVFTLRKAGEWGVLF